MNMLKLTLWRTKKQWLSHLLLSLELIFLFAGLMLMVYTIENYTKFSTLLSRIQGLDGAYYWTISDDYLYFSEDAASSYDDYMTSVEDNVMETGLFRGFGSITTDVISTDRGTYDLQIYNQSLRDNIQLPLKVGSWFSDSADVPEMIVDEKMAKQYPLGSTVEVTYEYTDWETGMDIVQTDTFKVVGVLNMQRCIFDFLAGGNGLQATDFFNSVEGYAIIVANSSDIIFQNAASTETRIAFLKDDITADEEQKAVEYLTLTGEETSFAEIQAKTHTFTLYRIGYEFPRNAMLIILGLLGLAGSLIVSHMMAKRENAIYVICGIRKGSLIAIEWIRCGVTSLLAFIIVALVMRLDFWGFKYDLETYLISFGISAVLIVGSLAIATTQISSANPINELRRGD